MKIFGILITTVLAFTSCNKVDVEKGTPRCITKKIKEFNKSPALCKDPTVDEYNFQGESVFVFNLGTCGRDFSSNVFDEDCNDLGYLGGFEGNDEINGARFSTSATFIKT